MSRRRPGPARGRGRPPGPRPAPPPATARCCVANGQPQDAAVPGQGQVHVGHRVSQAIGHQLADDQAGGGDALGEPPVEAGPADEVSSDPAGCDMRCEQQPRRSSAGQRGQPRSSPGLASSRSSTCSLIGMRRSRCAATHPGTPSPWDSRPVADLLARRGHEQPRVRVCPVRDGAQVAHDGPRAPRPGPAGPRGAGHRRHLPARRHRPRPPLHHCARRSASRDVERLRSDSTTRRWSTLACSTSCGPTSAQTATRQPGSGATTGHHSPDRDDSSACHWSRRVELGNSRRLPKAAGRCSPESRPHLGQRRRDVGSPAGLRRAASRTPCPCRSPAARQARPLPAR